MTGTGNKLAAFCCAKTNLYLRVAGKRPDSFHDIETLFWPVTKVQDHLEMDFAPGKGSAKIAIYSDAENLPCDSSNLCWKAVEKYFAASGIPPRNIAIYLQKKIPVSAGMGGGSSDCANVLLLMERYFGALGKVRLAALALELGSDVPFFLEPAPACGRGRGEKLELLPVNDVTLPLLFASPLFPVSAAWAYTHLDYGLCAEKEPALGDCAKALQNGDLPLLGRSLRNDLAPALYRKYPILPILHEKMELAGGHVLLSGSGPTLFALFESAACLKDAEGKLEGEFRELGIRLF